MLTEDLKIVSHASNKHSCLVPRLELVLVERNLATWVAVTIRGICTTFCFKHFRKL